MNEVSAKEITPSEGNVVADHATKFGVARRFSSMAASLHNLRFERVR
jgi:hypothetical protein